MNDSILMVEILDYQDTPASVAARIWWSAARGLTCDNLKMVELLREYGIMTPPGRLVFPKDGRLFFDALPFGFTGLERAQAPIVVEEQEGAPL